MAFARSVIFSGLLLAAACASAPPAPIPPAVALAPGANAFESGSAAARPDASAHLRIQQICEGRNDAQDVEKYDGEFGPARAFVLAAAPATARLVWNTDRARAYAPYQGTLYGAACTGTLVDADHLLTAAHCIEIGPSPRTNRVTPLRPTSDGGYESVPPEDIATLLDAEFNYQLAPDGSRRTSVSFAVEKAVEHGINTDRTIGIDFALLKLAPLPDGRRPGDLFAHIKWSAEHDAYDAATFLTVIQHPAGDFKKIHAGPKKAFSGASQRQELRYASIDTLANSSGSGIIDQTGRLIGVHVLGGCQEAVLFNAGVSLVAVRARSSYFSQSHQE